MDSSTPLPLTPADPAPAAFADAPASYEAALTELEQLVARMESGQLPLDQLMATYQRGASLLGYCRERLSAVENQLRTLDGAGVARPPERVGD